MKYIEDWEAVKNRYVAWWNREIVDRVPISILIRDEEKITEKREQSYYNNYLGRSEREKCEKG